MRRPLKSRINNRTSRRIFGSDAKSAISTAQADPHGSSDSNGGICSSAAKAVLQGHLCGHVEPPSHVREEDIATISVSRKGWCIAARSENRRLIERQITNRHRLLTADSTPESMRLSGCGYGQGLSGFHGHHGRGLGCLSPRSPHGWLLNARPPAADLRPHAARPRGVHRGLWLKTRGNTQTELGMGACAIQKAREGPRSWRATGAHLVPFGAPERLPAPTTKPDALGSTELFA